MQNITAKIMLPNTAISSKPINNLNNTYSPAVSLMDGMMEPGISFSLHLSIFILYVSRKKYSWLFSARYSIGATLTLHMSMKGSGLRYFLKDFLKL